MKIISDKRANVLRQIFRQMFISRSIEANMNFQIVVALACLLDIRGGGGGGGGGIRVLWIEDFRQNWGWIMDF